MSTTEHRLAANRANAHLSTGPRTTEGKAIASRNATRHGLLSARMFHDDEKPAEFREMCAELTQSLNPADGIEAALVERVAITLWRQRRLVQAEAASIALARQPRKLASGVGSELGRVDVKPEELTRFDPEREQWCRTALKEIEELSEIELDALEKQAPTVWGQLASDAEEDHQTPARYIADRKGGLEGFVSELVVWCHGQLRQAEARPHMMALAEHVRDKRLVLPTDTLELLARYQTTLDNQLYKALRALREAQAWRLKALEHQEPAMTPEPVADDASPVVEAA